MTYKRQLMPSECGALTSLTMKQQQQQQQPYTIIIITKYMQMLVCSSRFRNTLHINIIGRALVCQHN